MSDRIYSVFRMIREEIYVYAGSAEAAQVRALSEPSPTVAGRVREKTTIQTRELDPSEAARALADFAPIGMGRIPADSRLALEAEDLRAARREADLQADSHLADEQANGQEAEPVHYRLNEVDRAAVEAKIASARG